MKKTQNAFTLIELMVTLVVLAILAAIAMPAFNTMIANNRSNSLGHELTASMSPAGTIASHVDGGRLYRRLMELARFGATPKGALYS